MTSDQPRVWRSKDGSVTIICGDCTKADPSGPFHALLCDPPYHLTSVGRLVKSSVAQEQATLNDEKLATSGAARFFKSQAGFMGKVWDGGDIAFRPETWAALAQHLHPGAFGMAFASARGWHRLACAIEDAGLVIHPSIFFLGWLYASGFPKATRIDTQVDKAAGAERKVVGDWKPTGTARPNKGSKGHNAGKTTAADANYNPDDDVRIAITEPATPLARVWAGHRYGLQALKPALEPIIVFQKPYEGKPVDCITSTGAGALNIDGCRVEGPKRDPGFVNPKSKGIWSGAEQMTEWADSNKGRWPANFILSYPEDEYELRDDVTPEQLRQLAGWLDANR